MHCRHQLFCGSILFASIWLWGEVPPHLGCVGVLGQYSWDVSLTWVSSLLRFGSLLFLVKALEGVFLVVVVLIKAFVVAVPWVGVALLRRGQAPRL